MLLEPAKDHMMFILLSYMKLKASALSSLHDCESLIKVMTEGNISYSGSLQRRLIQETLPALV